MLTVENPVGRLLELRVSSPFSLEEMGPFQTKLMRLVSSAPGNSVACTDLRGARVMPDEVAARFVTIMKADNPRMERSGFLVSESALFSLQIERMLREAGNPMRRTFRESHEMVAWLSELLTAAESASARDFLAQVDSTAG